MIFVIHSPVKVLFTNQKKKKKSHTCEEGGAQLRISVCPLLMNLKNNYSFKKILKSANKNVRILILTILYFSKNIQKNT